MSLFIRQKQSQNRKAVSEKIKSSPWFSRLYTPLASITWVVLWLTLWVSYCCGVDKQKSSCSTQVLWGKQAQIITTPSTCLTTDVRYFCWCAIFGFLSVNCQTPNYFRSGLINLTQIDGQQQFRLSRSNLVGQYFGCLITEDSYILLNQAMPL